MSLAFGTRVRKRGPYLALTGEAQKHLLCVCHFGQVRAKRYYLVFSSETRNGILGDKMPVLPHPVASRVYLECTSSHGARTDATPGLRAPPTHVRTAERRESLIGRPCAGRACADGSTLWLFSPGASLVEGVTQAPCPQVLEGAVDMFCLRVLRHLPRVHDLYATLTGT